MFDISVLPLNLQAGQERADFPGLYVAGAPRKAVRLRAQDVLLLFLSLTNNGPVKEPVYSPAQQQEMLSRLAETFFTTSGSVTAGLRAVVTRLNEFLLNRNLRAASEVQVTGTLNLAVVHGDTILLAHAGPTHSILLGKSQTQIFDDRANGRGLGVNKQLVPRFYQAALESGNVLVVCPTPPDLWTARALDGASQLGLDHLRRRLLGQAGVEIAAAALKFQPGKGQILRYHGSPDQFQGETTQTLKASDALSPVIAPISGAQSKGPISEDSPPVESGLAASPVVPSESPPDSPLDRLPASPVETNRADEIAPVSTNEADELAQEEKSEMPLGAAPVEQTSKPVVDVAHGVARPSSRAPIYAGQSASEQSQGTRHRPQPVSKPRLRRSTGGRGFSQHLAAGIKRIMQSVGAFQDRVNHFLGPLVQRVIPQRSEPLISLSRGSLLFVAISIPLVVVAIATTVYVNAGRIEQFDRYVSTAGQYIDRATTQTDPMQQRESWVQAILWLDKAEQYRHSEISMDMRAQAQSGLDDLDGIVRLEYQRAVEQGFSADVNITRMAATLNDVYLLDSSQGRVLRIYRVGSSYQVDPNFVCRPGQAGGVIIGPLVDLAVLPPNNKYRATVLASDASGNLVYCAPNETGYDSLVMPGPDTNWGNIRAIKVSDGFIYVLDPLVNAVWYIFGNNESSFDQAPHLFFSNQVPQMDDVSAIAIDGGFLYLLHSDGRMTTCEASGFELSPTRCTDPTPYGDLRVGRDAAPLNFPDAHFVQIQTTQPPDPSLFILDDSQASVYHFSLRRLNLQRQYRPLNDPDFPMPEQLASAFVVTPNRRVLLAFGNQVFFANLP